MGIRAVNKKEAESDDRYSIVAELIYGSTLVGYLLRDYNGRELKRDRKATMKIISDGLVTNARVVSDSSDNLGRVEYIGVKATDIPKLDISNGSKGVGNSGKTEYTKPKDKVAEREVPDREIRIEFSDVKRAMKERKIVSTRDKRSTAHGAFRYPSIDIMKYSGACMYVVFGYGKFRVTRVSSESTFDNNSISCTISDMIGKRTLVVCTGISSVVCHMYTVAMIVMTVMQSDETGCLKEISYDNQENDMIWKEYISSGNTEQQDNKENEEVEVRNCIEITADDFVRLQKNYSINQSSLSALGSLMRYPTASMVMRKDAVMGIKTETGYYEVLKVESGIDNGIGLEVVMGSSIIDEKVAIRDKKATIEQINLRTFVMMCAAAIANTEKIQEVLVENEAEGSAIGYTFEYQRLARNK